MVLENCNIQSIFSWLYGYVSHNILQLLFFKITFYNKNLDTCETLSIFK